MRRIFGPKWDEIVGGWKKLHEEQLRNLYPVDTSLFWISRQVIFLGLVVNSTPTPRNPVESMFFCPFSPLADRSPF
jgi:hypothetical protein